MALRSNLTDRSQHEVEMIRNFYSGDYVKAMKDVAPGGVGRAIAARLLG